MPPGPKDFYKHEHKFRKLEYNIQVPQTSKGQTLIAGFIILGVQVAEHIITTNKLHFCSKLTLFENPWHSIHKDIVWRKHRRTFLCHSFDCRWDYPSKRQPLCAVGPMWIVLVLIYPRDSLHEASCCRGHPHHLFHP